MPRSFSCWNDRRRPDPRLFSVPGCGPNNKDDEEGVWNPMESPAGPVDELEQLIAGLLEDGEQNMQSGGAASGVAVAVPASQVSAVAQMLPTTHAVPVCESGAASAAISQNGCVNPRPLGMPAAAPSDSTKPTLTARSSVPLPPVEFVWRECDSCLVGVDLHGHPIERSALPALGSSGLRVHIELQPQLLYWADRRQWMWHKKWSLPTMTVRVERDNSGGGGGSPGANGGSNGGASAAGDKLSGAGNAAAGFERLYVVVSAGTLRDEGSVLEDQGLGGDCQRVLELRPHGATEVSFTRLLFQQTSFNCGGRAFHLVVTITAAPPRVQPNGSREEGVGTADTVNRAPLKPLACICSSPVRVDARKRSKGERPEAAEDDVRLVNRQRPASSSDPNAAATPNQLGHPSALQAGPAAGPGGEEATASDLLGADTRFSAHALIDATSDAFVEVRPDGVVVQMLSSTAFGYTPAQLLGRSLLTICHTDEHPGLLQTMQALLMMACASAAGRGDGTEGVALVAGGVPRTVRMLHRVIVGLGGERTAEAVAVDTIVSVTAAAVEGTAPRTLLLSSRRALPIGAHAGSSNFSFRIFPWPG